MIVIGYLATFWGRVSITCLLMIVQFVFPSTIFIMSYPVAHTLQHSFRSFATAYISAFVYAIITMAFDMVWHAGHFTKLNLHFYVISSFIWSWMGSFCRSDLLMLVSLNAPFFVVIVCYSTLLLYGHICKTTIDVVTSLLETWLNF